VSAGIVVPLVVVAIALVVWGVITSERRRRERMRAVEVWAAARGWDYEPDRVSTVERRFAHFPCFVQGDARYAYNVVRGHEGEREVWAFDYHYQTYSTDSKGNRTTHHHHFSALVLETHLLLEPLSIRPESWWDKLAGLVGFDDIDFESAEFSRAFHVKSKNRRFAYDVIPQETMEFLLESPRFSLQAIGPHLLATNGRTFRAPEFEQALAVAEGFLARIPKDLREAMRLRPS
jgi:hypothetical protein